MRPIHSARLDKTRPVLILTREVVRRHLSRVAVAPITGTIRGLSTEVPMGPANGLDHDSVVSCDSIVTVPVSALGRQLGSC
jgi:mRNA interferase MazF